jgi:hypothetical protein
VFKWKTPKNVLFFSSFFIWIRISLRETRLSPILITSPVLYDFVVCHT